MPTTIFLVAAGRRAELDQALSDDQIARQSRKIRDAATLGGPPGELYVLIEGAAEAIARADALLAPLGRKLPEPERAALERRFREEDESASAGMGLFFTE